MTVYDLKTMQITKPQGSLAVALGTFDGCHLGHASVLQNTFYKARELKIKSLVYTFDTSALKGQGLVLTLEEKIKAIGKFGIDYVAIEQFDNVRNLGGEEFVNSVLKEQLGATFVSCGYNYRFGKNASCTAENLVELFEKVGGSVQISPEITYNNVPVSSTLVRNKIKNGEVEELLSYMRPYSIYSMVERGKGMGKGLGFATINQQIPKGKVVPKTGVYITECEIGEDVYPAITNVGYRPTTDGENSRLNVETHIIGFSKDLYSSYLRVNFYKYLREEIKFSSFEELREQVERDKGTALEYFGFH
ncbi:MAG: bifunctional riboflavin kinase/FAD synthetase [Ruminococcaceae bacterium]|nr:bifunctional riboflavin kinase/FAD synthetase [Oscillospiraceae bacterium]